jgi:hypothetical protein
METLANKQSRGICRIVMFVCTFDEDYLPLAKEKWTKINISCQVAADTIKYHMNEAAKQQIDSL